MTTWRRLGLARTDGLVSLGEMRSHVRVDHQEEDALIGAYLSSAVEYAEGFCRRPFLPGACEAEVALPGGRGAVALPCPPGAALEVERIEYRDAAGAVQELEVAAWELIDGAEPELRPAPGSSWPADAQGREARVRYSVAYPEDVKPSDTVRLAVMLLAGHWYANRESVIVGTISGEAPHGVDMLLWPHRRLVFG